MCEICQFVSPNLVIIYWVEKSGEKTGALFKLTLRQWSSGDDLALSDSRHK